MKAHELTALGIPSGEATKAAQQAAAALAATGLSKERIRKRLKRVTKKPETFIEDKILSEVARLVMREAALKARAHRGGGSAPWRMWGTDIEPESVKQMKNACSLPVSVAGALMPDAHLGYGLPIGGVLGTRNAIIPYAVGVDIACRVKLTVMDIAPEALNEDSENLRRILEGETRFGVGATFAGEKRQHAVMDRDWSVSPVTMQQKDKAWAQLGTSGSGNHFVEFGVFTVDNESLGIPAGQYLALLSHSGSRGTGYAVCSHYSKIAQKRHGELPRELQHLAWLDLDSQEGNEYWDAMNLMGDYASANHDCIHRHIVQILGAETVLDIENHHNFAWKETHGSEELIVHRKGATPAGKNVLGVIPGTMATPAHIVRGLGSAASLESAAHGAGRVMSRKQAKRTLNWRDGNAFLQRAGVKLLSAGLDEVPMVYKNIETVMAAQTDLVRTVATFMPRLVKMAKEGERPED